MVLLGRSSLGIMDIEVGNVTCGKTLYRKTSDGRLMSSCYDFGKLEYDQVNVVKAKLFFKKSSDGGNTDSCYALRSFEHLK